MHLTTRRARARLILASLASISFVAAGCGSDQTADPSTAAPATTAAATSVAATEPAATEPAATEPAATEPEATSAATDVATTEAPTTEAPAPAPVEVAIDLADYSITMPATLQAGLTRLSATNHGAVEHHVIFARAHDGLHAADVLGVFATDVDTAQTMVDIYPGPAGVGPGATGIVDVFLPAGEYIAMCVIPAADGMPHAAKGMFQLITVTGDPGSVVEASSDSAIDLTDFDFRISDDFTGQGSVLVTNRAQQLHELDIYREGEGGSLPDFMARAMDPAKDEAEFAKHYQVAGGISPMSPGRTGVMELDLAPGTYVFVCYVPDATDGLPHAMHGMVKEVVVD